MTTPLPTNWVDNSVEFHASDMNNIATQVNANTIAIEAAYVKPTNGVPLGDLDPSVRADLSLASTALQPGSSTGGSGGTTTIIQAAAVDFGIQQSELAMGSGFGTGYGTPVVNSIVDGIRVMGAKRVRLAVYWSAWETTQGVYGGPSAWANLDTVFASCVTYGVVPLICITGPVPTSYTPTTTDFANFCTAVAHRYGAQGTGQVSNYEIWNEPNIQGSAVPGTFTAANYASWFNAASIAIKAADTGAFIIAGGTGAGTTTSTQIDPVDWVTGLYANGCKSHLDAIGYHWYSTDGVYGTVQEPSDTQAFYTRMVSCRNVMVANGDSAKTVWMTEFAIPVPQATAQVAAHYMAEQINLMIKLPWIQTFIVLGYQQSSINPAYGLVDVNGNKLQPKYGVIYNINAAAREVVDASVTPASIAATGTPSATTFLRGDGQWQLPPTAGTVADHSITATQLAADAVTEAAMAVSGTPNGGQFLRDDFSWAYPTTSATPANGSVTEAMISASGTPSVATFLRGDWTWASPPSGGGSGTAPPELITGSAPAYVVNSQAGGGATVTVAGTKLSHSITVTTGNANAGGAPVNGAILCTCPLGTSNPIYVVPPQVYIAPANAAAETLGAYAVATTSSITIYAAGDVQPNSTYAFNVLLIGATFTDTTPPTAPSAPTINSFASTTASVTCTGSTDNVSVAGYNFYFNGVKLNSSVIPGVGPVTVKATGLHPSTAYSVYCTAVDEVGQESAHSTAVPFTTNAALNVVLDAVGSNTGVSTTSGNTITTTWTQVVSVGDDGILLAAVGPGTATLWNTFSTYTVNSVTSSIDGPLTKLQSFDVGPSGQSEGSLHLWQKTRATVGTHVMTAVVTCPSTAFASLLSGSVNYLNVGSTSGLSTAGSGSGTSTLSASVASVTGGLAIIAAGFRSAESGFSGTQRFLLGPGSGYADYLLFGDTAGAATVTFTDTTTDVWGAIVLSLNKAT